MKKIIWLSITVFLLTAASFAQTPTPTPKAAEEEADVVKISTTLIQIDVTVTDKDDRVVTDLKPEDFEVFENGEKQDITNFSFVGLSSPAVQKNSEQPKVNDQTAAVIPPVQLRPEQVRRTIALVVDDLGLSFESVYYVRRALRKFVDEQMQANDLVAIIRTGAGAGALQQFTSDRRQLYAAIEAVKWNSFGRGGLSAFAPLEATPLEQRRANGDQTVSDEDLAEEQNQLRGVGEFREDVFSIGTLGAINFILKGMSDLPGRKSIMLFSDGFGICSGDNLDRCARIVDSVRQLTDLSNRAAVSIYSFDARGLQSTAITAEDNLTDITPERVQNANSSRANEMLTKQDGLSYLAKETGGRTFFNSNNINKGLEKALEDLKGYYLIGYQPDTDTFDAKTRRFNKLQIRVKRKDTKVRYRSGFFGITDEQIIKKPANRTPAQQIQTALTSPFAVSEVSLRLNTLFANDKQQGSLVRSLLHINTNDLKFSTEADGSKKVVFDILAMSFGENGTPIDQISKTYMLKVKPEGYDQLLREGLVYYFAFPVKKPGAYQYRIAVRDSASAKVGSVNQFIEIPNLKKNNLTVSGIVLENLTAAEWQKLTAKSPAQIKTPDGNEENSSDLMNDTSLRRFKRGTILRYGFEIYNAKHGSSQKPDLSFQTKIFRDGKPVFEGKQTPLVLAEQTDLQRIKSNGALNLGDDMQAGDYVLQIIVIDNLAKEKRNIATQFVQFEIQ